MDRNEHKNAAGSERNTSPEVERPPLPPRRSELMQSRPTSSHGDWQSTRSGLVSEATTALSVADVNSYGRTDGTRELRLSPSRITSSASAKSKSNRTSDIGEDSSSVKSFTPYGRQLRDTESIFGGAIDNGADQPWLAGYDTDKYGQAEDVEKNRGNVDFEVEFQDLDNKEMDDDKAYKLWKAKRKHFIIFSAAGKPIYTRHGSDNIISSYVGIIQTIISSFQSTENQLRSFQAADVKFAILSQTNLFLVAVSSLPESDNQLRSQLEALYMQILSTLTLPTLTHIFSVRPSSDLRRPLQGTEVLLSSLADSFTRGSPSTLLSALECLKIRKSHRSVINNALLRARVDDLLYGLVVAGGRLVSVVRPKKHSLHPSDLQLIFNMLFEAEGVKAGGGESWIPICLPGFNRTGYLYMYVSFLDMGGDTVRELDEDEKIAKEDAVAIILLSANKESFESMQSMKNYLVHEFHRTQSMRVIQTSLRNGRPQPVDIIPGTGLRHFLYKSKGNVQFFMPSFSPEFENLSQRRQLMSLYHNLHASIHAKHATVKVHHSLSGSASALAWVTPMFELYCVAGATTPRNALAQSANKIVQWIQREEERIFIIGGAVF